MSAEPLRLIIDSPGSGSWNMALDQALLDSAADLRLATLRIYRWSPATISLGYFQPFSQRYQHTPSIACPVVRRSTGGGAIVHDHELTYSLCLHNDDQWSRENQDVLELTHNSLIDTLREFGMDGCELFDGSVRTSGDQPFLCFLRRAHGDVVLGKDKIIGSAQRRVRGALLQHGSLLIGSSRYAPELSGLTDLFDTPFDEAAFCARWTSQFGERLGKCVEVGAVRSSEIDKAHRFEQRQFSTENWSKKR